MIRDLIAKSPRAPVVVLDLLGNFDQPRDKKTNYVFCDKISDIVEKILKYKKDPDAKKRILVIRPQDPAMAVDFVSEALWQAQGGTLVLDEADAFSVTDAPKFDFLIRYGRNRNIDLITGCRRPAEISRHITAAANKVFCFATQEPRDVEYFKKTLFGERAERLMSLERYHGLFLDYDSLDFGEYHTDHEGRVFVDKTEKLT